MSENMPGSIPSNTLGVLGDIFQKVAKGKFTHDELSLFAQRKNPFAVVEVPQVKVRPDVSSLFKPAETDLEAWLAHAGQFALEHFGITFDLHSKIPVSFDLPWKNIIPVFDPGGLTNREVIEKALKGLKLNVWEEVDVMDYSGSRADPKPSLWFIENSERPSQETMGLSPNQLRKTNKHYLSLRGYALAFGLYHFVTGKYLDPETFTWFPENCLSSGDVASGLWDPGIRGVRFRWGGPDGRSDSSGARLAIPVPLDP